VCAFDSKDARRRLTASSELRSNGQTPSDPHTASRMTLIPIASTCTRKEGSHPCVTNLDCAKIRRPSILAGEHIEPLSERARQVRNGINSVKL
jgi:hypothetical protein